MHRTPTVGPLCITLVQRYAIVFLLSLHALTPKKGYLDIVRWLCEEGATPVDGASGIDVRSKGGWTPLSTFGCRMCDPHTEHYLVNAASKGHLPVVRYLLTKQSANPLVRNNWGETAYDTSAAVFEVWICEVSRINCS